MNEDRPTTSGRKYNPSLDGIRGYGFLAVFLLHYFGPEYFVQYRSTPYRVLAALECISYFAVPVFFVLSGFLIGGILYNTRNREGFFRVFYGRRIIRIFPVYYLALLGVACVLRVVKFPLTFQFWSHFLFIQNLFPHFSSYSTPLVLTQYWTLATEEQFYLAWPLVVWFLPKRRRLFAAAGFLVLVSFAIRFEASHIFSNWAQIRYLSFTRGDAILLGVMLGFVYKEPSFRWVKAHARWFALAGITAMAIWTFCMDRAWPQSFRGEQCAIPLVNFTAVALVVDVMEEKSWLGRVCSRSWIGWLGRMSYSLYIVHFIYAKWFRHVAVGYFVNYMPRIPAVLLSGVLAFCLTLALAMLSYYLIEMPCQKLRKRLNYGAVKEPRVSPGGDRVLAENSPS
jgi:peptidoglycan/LPS O-acetylase OafA/YrhL